MTITLTKPVEEFIQRAVAEGAYSDADQAINAACLRLMREAEDMRAAETPEWRAYVLAKLDEAEHGSFVAGDRTRDIERLMKEF